MSEEQRPETGEGVRWNPQTGFPAPSNPDGQPVPPPPPPPPPPYGQPPAYDPGQAYDPTQAYPQGYPGLPYGYGYPAAEHPQAKTALVLGIVALAGGFFCALPILVSPFAWVVGHRARRAIRREPQRYAGESTATAGMVMGIIGTVLLLLAVIGLVLFIVILASSVPSDPGVGSNV